MYNYVLASRSDTDMRVALYIGLLVACAVFSCIATVLFLLHKRKGRDHSMYNMAVSGKLSSWVFSKLLSSQSYRSIYNVEINSL